MNNIRAFLLIGVLALCGVLPWYAQALPGTTASLLSVYTTDNVPALTIGYVDQYGNANGGQLTFNGSTSGATILKPAAVAGSGTITLPTATGTLSSTGGTETLTNKTLTAPVINNPIINGPAPVACGATCTLGASNAGTYTRLDTAAGSVATLPGATGSGTVYRLYVSVATTSAADKVLTNPVTDTVIGTAQGENAGTAKVFVGNAGTFHSIQMPFAGTQPSGGFIGDTIVCTDVASTIWKCDIQYQAGTTPTTPYSAATT